jgi:hypothetical protein
MERAVGWFVILATVLLAFGFGYYVYQTAERKGWFIKKITYQTSISSGAGLKEGDPVKLMGFDVGEITRIQPNDPYAYYNITVEFRIKAPYFGYLWSDSAAKVASADLLGHRYVEVTKGKEGVSTVDETNKVAVGILKRDYFEQRQGELSKQFTNHAEMFRALRDEVQTNKNLFYSPLAKTSVYWLDPEDSPALAERLESLVTQVEKALPGILDLTNRISLVLSNSAILTSNLNFVAVDARPAVSNLALITAQWNQPGAFGEWLLPTNLNQKLDATLSSANTNLDLLAANLDRVLDNLSGITSNLNSQVQANSNILGSISRTVRDADDFVQGLKHHWLLRSVFKHKAPERSPAESSQPLRSPKKRGDRE